MEIRLVSIYTKCKSVWSATCPPAMGVVCFYGTEKEDSIDHKLTYLSTGKKEKSNKTKGKKRNMKDQIVSSTI